MSDVVAAQAVYFRISRPTAARSAPGITSRALGYGPAPMIATIRTAPPTAPATTDCHQHDALAVGQATGQRRGGGYAAAGRRWGHSRASPRSGRAGREGAKPCDGAQAGFHPLSPLSVVIQGDRRNGRSLAASR